MTDARRVSVVIPNWNGADLLRQILKQLQAQTYPIAEILVVDNGSTDASAAIADNAGARVIRLERNLGFAPAVNRGIAEARAEWIAILNNDVTIGAEWLDVMIAQAEAEGAWLATGKLLKARQPAEIDATFDAVSRAGMSWRCGHSRRDGSAWSQGRATFFVPFTAAIFRKALFDRVGLLDERFESYLEDSDFGIRCAAAGFRGVYVPGAVGRHLGSATLGAWHKATVRRIARNQILIAAKHLRGGPRWPLVVGNLLWILVAIRHGRGWACIRGKIEGLRLARNLPSATGWGKVGEILKESEQQIRQLQQLTGFDWYWKLYFALVRN